MDPRLGWILAIVVLWIVVRLLVRRPRLSQRVPVQWLTGKLRGSHRPKVALRYKPYPSPASRKLTAPVTTDKPPYSFAHRGPQPGTWLDLSTDARPERLASRQLPNLQTPDALAAWCELPVNRLAWLAHRCSRGRPTGTRQSHYFYTWKPKRSGGLRLIESPKRSLKRVQQHILKEILNRLPVSESAHGFRTGRSIVTNAEPHVGAAVVLKFDLQDFYVNVRAAQVIRVFRMAGYSREAAIWLTRLTTSAIPGNLPLPAGDHYGVWNYRKRHLPQGAPTSPALANLVAYRLDQRLAGLARRFGGTYTRYADDLTFSGDAAFGRALRVVIPLVEQIITQEGFRSNRGKRQILRTHQQQRVAGVVVNEKLNFCRRDFDRLKAVLHQCVKFGPASQNRDDHADFSAHLRGRIAHVCQLNPDRGKKLWALFENIDWRR